MASVVSLNECQVQKSEHVRTFVDQLADRLPEAVPGVGINADDDRSIARLRGLERRRELERVRRTARQP